MHAVYTYVYIDSNICGDRTWNHMGMNVECAFATPGDILTDRHELDHYELRNYENLRIPLHSTIHSQLFIGYRAIKTCNRLPGALGRASSISSFRNKLRLMLRQQ